MNARQKATVGVLGRAASLIVASRSKTNITVCSSKVAYPKVSSSSSKKEYSVVHRRDESLPAWIALLTLCL